MKQAILRTSVKAGLVPRCAYEAFLDAIGDTEGTVQAAFDATVAGTVEELTARILAGHARMVELELDGEPRYQSPSLKLKIEAGEAKTSEATEPSTHLKDEDLERLRAAAASFPGGLSVKKALALLIVASVAPWRRF